VLTTAAWGYAAYTNEHIDAPILGDFIGGPSRKLWDIFIQGSLLFFLYFVTVFGFTAALRSLEILERQGTDVYVWPARFWLPLAAGAFLLVALMRFGQAVVEFIRELRAPKAP